MFELSGTGPLSLSAQEKAELMTLNSWPRLCENVFEASAWLKTSAINDLKEDQKSLGSANLAGPHQAGAHTALPRHRS